MSDDGPTAVPHILLVDDDSHVRNVVEAYLSGQGYNVVAASSGAEALGISSARLRPVDLLITDLIMPGMTGHELVQRLLESQAQLRVLYISGYDDALPAPPLDQTPMLYLAKPFQMTELLRHVQTLLA